MRRNLNFFFFFFNCYKKCTTKSLILNTKILFFTFYSPFCLFFKFIVLKPKRNREKTIYIFFIFSFKPNYSFQFLHKQSSLNFKKYYVLTSHTKSTHTQTYTRLHIHNYTVHTSSTTKKTKRKNEKISMKNIFFFYVVQCELN